MTKTLPAVETAHHCQYIGADYTRVGQCQSSLLHNHSSYCTQHHAQIYQAGSGRRVRHRDIRTANAVWDLQSELDQAIKELDAEGFAI